MKKRTKEFIKAMNTQAYSQRLKDMIECEKVCYFFLLLFDKYIQKYVCKNSKFYMVELQEALESHYYNYRHYIS